MDGHTGTGIVGVIAVVCLLALCWVGGLATLQMKAGADQIAAESEIARANEAEARIRAEVQSQANTDNARLAILQQGQDHFRQDLILLMAAMHDDGQFTVEEIGQIRALVDREQGTSNGDSIKRTVAVLVAVLAAFIAFRLVVWAWYRGWAWYKEWWLFQEGRYRE